MDFFSLLTDPKVWLIIAIVALLIVLGIYTWRQSNHIEELKNQHSKITEQVRHGLKLSDDNPKALVHLRPDITSNMSDETCDAAQHDQEWDEEHEDDDEDASDDEHNAYIQQLIRIQDTKRAKLDEFIIPSQQQTGHTGPVYESHDEEIIFRDYDDAESDGASKSELIQHIQEELSHLVKAKEETPIKEETPAKETPSFKIKVKAKPKALEPTEKSLSPITELKIQNDMSRMDAELQIVKPETEKPAPLGLGLELELASEPETKPKIVPLIKPKPKLGRPPKQKD